MAHYARQIERFFVLRIEHKLWREGISAMKESFSSFGANVKQVLTGTNAEMEKAKAVQAAALDKLTAKVAQTSATYDKSVLATNRATEAWMKSSAATAAAAAAAEQYVSVTARMQQQVAGLAAKEAEMTAIFGKGQRAMEEYYGSEKLAGSAAMALIEKFVAEKEAISAAREALEKKIVIMQADGTAAEMDAVAQAKLSQEIERQTAAELANAAATEKARNAQIAAAAEADAARAAQASAGGAGAEAGAGGALTSRLSGLGGAMGALLGAIPLIGGAFAGLLLLVDHMAVSTAKYSAEVLRNAQVLGFSSNVIKGTGTAFDKAKISGLDFYQTIRANAETAGIAPDRLFTMLARFSQNLQKLSAQDLRQFGIGLDQSKGKVTDLSTAIAQYSDWLTHATASQRNLATQQLIGTRGADAFNKIIETGTGDIAHRVAVLQDEGIVLDAEQLKMNAFGNAVHTMMTQTLTGVARQVSGALMPAFALLWSMIANGAKGSASVIATLGGIAIKVALFIIGFFSGLAGHAIDTANLWRNVVGSIQGVTDDIGTANDANNEMAASQKSAKQQALEHKDALDGQRTALDRLRQSTTAQTEAIDAQIEAIRNAPSAIQQQIDALNDTKNAYQQQIDAIEAATQAEVDLEQQRLAASEENLRLMELEQQQQDELHQSFLSSLQDQLDALNDVNENRKHSGESLVEYERRLQENNLKDQIKKEENSRALTKTTAEIALEKQRVTTQEHIKLLTQEKDAAVKSLTEARDFRLRVLQEEKRAEDAARNHQIKNLEDQKKALDNNLKAREQAFATAEAANQKAMEDTKLAGLDDMAGLTAGVGSSSEDMKRIMKEAFKDINKDGSLQAAQLGNNVGASINGMVTSFTTAKDKIGAVFSGLFSISLPNLINNFKNVNWTKFTDTILGFATTLSTVLPSMGLFIFTQLAGWIVGVAQNPMGALKGIANAVEWIINRIIHLANDFIDKIPTVPGLNWKVPDLPYFNNDKPIFDEGGIVTGPRDIRVAANALPEVIIPLTKPGRAAQLMRQTGLDQLGSNVGAGVSFENNFYGPIATALVGSMVVDRMAADVRRRGLLSRLGVN